MIYLLAIAGALLGFVMSVIYIRFRLRKFMGPTPEEIIASAEKEDQEDLQNFYNELMKSN